MLGTRRKTALGLLAAMLPILVATSSLTPSAAAAPTSVALRDATPLSAYAGTVAFSRRDSSGLFRLTLLRSGVQTVTPVAASHVPFDVDLGPDGHGGLAAVFSRCATDPPLAPQFDSWTTGHGRGCRVYRADLKTGREILVSGTHQAGASESMPTIWKDRVAFVRTVGKTSAVPQLWVRRGQENAVRLSGGPTSVCKVSGRRRACASGPAPAPLALDLRNRQLAYSWRMPDFAEGQAHEIRIAEPGRPSRLIQHTGGGGLSDAFVAWPIFDGASLFYARACFGDPNGCVRRARITRYDTATRRRTTQPLPSRSTIWFTHTAATSFTLVAPLPTSGTCTADEPSAPSTCELRAG